VRAILIAIVVIAVVAFAFYNVGTLQKVEVNLIYATYVDVPLIVVVFWSFVVGLVVSLLLFVTMYIRMSMEMRSYRRRIRGLEAEVAVLRNRPIEESAEFLKGADQRGLDSQSPFSKS